MFPAHRTNEVAKAAEAAKDGQAVKAAWLRRKAPTPPRIARPSGRPDQGAKTPRIAKLSKRSGQGANTDHDKKRVLPLCIKNPIS